MIFWMKSDKGLLLEPFRASVRYLLVPMFCCRIFVFICLLQFVCICICFQARKSCFAELAGSDIEWSDSWFPIITFRCTVFVVVSFRYCHNRFLSRFLSCSVVPSMRSYCQLQYQLPKRLHTPIASCLSMHILVVGCCKCCYVDIANATNHLPTNSLPNQPLLEKCFISSLEKCYIFFKCCIFLEM